MLKAAAEFPYAGSTGYLSPTAEEVRILQRNADGSTLVARTERAPALRSASDTLTVPATRLHATAEKALARRGNRRAA